MKKKDPEGHEDTKSTKKRMKGREKMANTTWLSSS